MIESTRRSKPGSRSGPRIRQRTLCRVAAIVALTSSLACTTFGVPPPRSCVPEFPYAGGWLGGDSAYSVALGGGRSVWLFGDTFVGAAGQATRRGAAFVHNSIGISDCSAAGEWAIDYTWGVDADGAPQAFVEAGSDDRWWWLFGGFTYRGRLFVGMLDVERGDPRGPFGLPFHFTGMELARIDNPTDPPDAWRIEVLPLSADRVAFPGAAMVVAGPHAYLFAFLDRGDGRLPRMLARIELDSLDGPAAAPAASMEYLARDGTWAPGLDPDDARIVMDDSASEMSVHYDPERGVWRALYNHPHFDGEGAVSADVLVRIAERLEGPWSEPEALFEIPELRDVPDDPSRFCYAAKEHPQYAGPDELLFTYVCNLFASDGQGEWDVLSRLLDEMDLYRPRSVSLPLRPSARSREAPDPRSDRPSSGSVSRP